MNYFKELYEQGNLGKLTVEVEMKDGNLLTSEKLVPLSLKEKAKDFKWENHEYKKLDVSIEEVKGTQHFGNKLGSEDIAIPIIEEFNKCELSHEEEVFILLIQRDREGITKGYNYYKELMVG